MAYIAKLPAFAIITLAETVSFKSPQPLPDSEDQAGYGGGDFISRSKDWYTRICLVSSPLRPRVQAIARVHASMFMDADRAPAICCT